MNRYVVTVLLTAAAAGSCLALAGAFGLRPPSFVVLFVAAAFASAWYGGFRAGLLSTTLGTIALILLLTKPEYSLRIDRPDEQVALLAFLIISLVGNWLCSIAHAERRAASPVRRPSFWRLGCFVVANLAAAALGEGLKLIPGVSITFWPPSGIFVAALLLSDRRSWPWWVAGACAAELIGGVLWFHNPPHLALLYFSANAAEALTAALLVRWAVPGKSSAFSPRQLESPRNALLFVVLAGAIAPLVGATVIAGADAILGKHDFATAWQLVWLGDGTGLLLAAPLTLAAVQVWRRRRRIPVRLALELALTCGLAVMLTWLALRGHLPTVYLALPAIVWAAVRFQVRGAWVVLAAVILTVAAFTRSGLGEFSGAPGQMRDRLIALQVFLAVCASTALIVAGLSARHVRARERLRIANESLERRIQERTAALRESEDLLRRTVDTAATGLTRCSRDLRYLSANPAYAEIVGLPVEQIVGRPIVDVVGPEAFEATRPYVERVLRGERIEYEAEMPLAGRESRYAHIVYTPDVNPQGGIVGWVASIMDITERKRAEEELRTADRRKNEFLATLAHELRNPLAPIRNGLRVLRLAGQDPAAVEQALGMMERQLGQMVRLVDDLMDVSRISRGRIELRKERILLASVVQSAVETSRPLIEQMGHELTVLLPERQVLVEADPTRLSQVFLNLLNNAAKYSDPGGRIRLAVEQQGMDVTVSVRDSGIGIDADHMPGVFEMFSQADRSQYKAQGGLGIGLSLVKRLVDLHGGSIEAKSDGPGKGAEFIVRLPIVVEAPAPRPEVRPKPAASKSSLRILIVDDNQDGAESLAMILKVLGHDTRTAYDGEKGVELAAELSPDVVLFDIGLPKRNGYEACRLVRRQPGGDKIIIIAVTGWGSTDDRQRSKEAGFDHHLVKPVDAGALMKLLAELTAARR